MTYCAIDFGTSNSAVALPRGGGTTGMRLAPVEGEHLTLPTAIFFNTDESTREYGRAALASYIDGFDGRLMRSMKSILGSPLAETTTDLGDGSAIAYTDVIALFLMHLKQKAEACAGGAIGCAVLGRPVFFVDDDPRADRLAQQQLEAAAHAVGLADVQFQYEPIAAAFDYESRQDAERLVLVADIGGGTSDFSLVRVGPERMRRLERKDDVLAHHGVHVAGTDYDRRVELSAVLSAFGYRALDPEGRELPNRIYFDLATWHLINTVYTPKRVGELKLMKHLYADARHFDRLLRVVEQRLGHALAARAEEAKIGVSAGGETMIDLNDVEEDLLIAFDADQLIDASRDETARIVDAARETVRLAGIAPRDVGALYFTGGSTGLAFLSGALAAVFPDAQPVYGDRLASVATGLGIHAQRVYGG
ncbi:Hsp70 family protein [Burkholderia pseudomallei]|uniref:Hsp70 family protein n=1 Tax=Burkholderia pseudomallei TaxID=28450 RepID=UPI00050F68E5|nr:Hsp70 family protein [Burkholderia pseudomallei]KGX75601.1 hsp70 family protein [Burkholderia pseudomallei MSHR435]AIV60547.1 hsp70 family protein [Burkholderia pseudomallei MSHR2243]AIV71134.1 hsp70 family protein [Burkholderia pseudomallei MSHR62]AJX21543.1 hsp70 family protein [Burkholderia pseudomallei MSHR491]KGC90861.1 hsp70 family protein [Burkholderia pseudomallei]